MDRWASSRLARAALVIASGLSWIAVTAMGCSGSSNGGQHPGNSSSSSGGGSTSSSGGTPGVPAGCTEDSSLGCQSDAIGITCPAGTSPDSPTLACSDPTPAGSEDGYCCLGWTATAPCEPDPAVPGCNPPSFGFSCPEGSGPPTESDPNMICSDPSNDPTSGRDLYCCEDEKDGTIEPTTWTLAPIVATFVQAEFATHYVATVSTSGTLPANLTAKWRLRLQFVDLPGTPDPTLAGSGAGIDTACNNAGVGTTTPVMDSLTGGIASTTDTFIWHHPDPANSIPAGMWGCDHTREGPSGHQGIIVVTVSDGMWDCTATYEGTNSSGTGNANASKPYCLKH